MSDQPPFQVELTNEAEKHYNALDDAMTVYSLRVKTPPHPRTLWVRALSPSG